MIEVKNLVKKYGSHLAVDHLNFTVDTGQIYGFLGPNGAGKSTTMNMLTGYISSTSGQALINGTDILEDPIKAKAQIGYLPELPPLYLDMTVMGYLNFVYDLKKCKLPRRSHLKDVCNLCRISDVSGRVIKHLSKGYRQRVGLAQAILGFPKIIILDEPTVGLDPEERIHFRNLFSRTAQDRLVLLSTHIIEDVQSVCDRLVVIDHGQILFTGTPEQLIQAAEGHVGVFWEREAGQEQGLHITARVNTSQGVRCRAVADALPAYVQRSEPSLEDAYLYLISREAVQ